MDGREGGGDEESGQGEREGGWAGEERRAGGEVDDRRECRGVGVEEQHWILLTFG